MKETFNHRYKQVCHLAEMQGEAFAEVVTESFDDLDSLGEFVDTLFYMHSITDDEQFPVFLGMMYEIMGSQMPEEIDYQIVMEQRPSIFYSCFLSSFLTGILNRIKTDLYPVLRNKDKFDLKTAQMQVKAWLESLLKLEDNEQEFLDAFRNKTYQPELLFESTEIVERIRNHPMALWKCSQK